MVQTYELRTCSTCSNDGAHSWPDSSMVNEKLTKCVDLFLTLVKAAGLPQLPLCQEDFSKTELCREGVSLIHSINNQSPGIKRAFLPVPKV